ncbi:MAG: ribokinase [Planctomycetales bacterium]|nr:ribokinase [Planctomycetales bacterium]
MSVLILGSVNTDLVIRSPRLPRPGETVLGGEFYQAAGGKGANQAVAAARAAGEHGKVTFIGALGEDDYGRESRRGLLAEGIDCSCLKEIATVPSGIALILVDEQGENLISVASGANAHLLPGDVDAASASLFLQCKVFLACLELPLPTVERGLARAKELGLLTILNPAPVQDAAEVTKLLPLVDVLTPNELELTALAGISVETPDSAAAAARIVQSQGAKNILVTLGAAGSVLIDESGMTHHIPPFPVTPIDTTAAGDCFSGSLAVALADGQPLVSAVRFASAAAAISVTRRGAQPSLPRQEEIETLLKSVNYP